MTAEKTSTGTPVGRVLELAGLVDYQENSVVSCTVIKKEKGTVTVFAFDRSQSLSEHTVPFDALVHVLEGTAEITISGKAHRLNGGEMIIMPGNAPHAVNAVEKFKMALTMLKS